MAFPLQFILENLLSHAVMGKKNKKHSKKDGLSEDMLDVAALSIKKFRKMTKEIGRLSTGQRLVGGAALLAAGLVYLASQADAAPAGAAPDGVGARPEASKPAVALGTDDLPDPRKPPKAAGKARKGPKTS